MRHVPEVQGQATESASLPDGCGCSDGGDTETPRSEADQLQRTSSTLNGSNSRGIAVIQLLRFGTIGLASNALLYFAYLAITTFGMESKLAMTLCYAIGVVQTFLWNGSWTFHGREVRAGAFTRYILSYAAGYVLNFAALAWFVDVVGLPHQVVQGAVILVLAPLFFLCQKFWVFRKNRNGCLA